jgi:hypothetical protein
MIRTKNKKLAEYIHTSLFFKTGIKKESNDATSVKMKDIKPMLIKKPESPPELSRESE